MGLVTIAAGDIAEYHGNGVPTTARLFANQTFTDSTGVLVAQGSPRKPEFYQTFAVSMVGTTVRIASGDAFSTVDSSNALARYTLVLYDANNRALMTVFTQLRIPATPSSTTWEALRQYSASRVFTGQRAVTLEDQLAGKQNADDNLTQLAAIDALTKDVIVSDGAGWVGKTFTQLKTLMAFVKGDIGLGNVDNTSDVNKPVSTAQAAADSAAIAVAEAYSTQRSNHTGTQTASTVSDFNAAALLAAPAETATTIGALVNAATNKSIPVDADLFGGADSAASNVLKKFTWANIKAALLTYFNTKYSIRLAQKVIVADELASTTDATWEDGQSMTLGAGQLANVGDTASGEFEGAYIYSGGAPTVEIRLMVGAVPFLVPTAVGLSADRSWKISFRLVRATASLVRYWLEYRDSNNAVKSSYGGYSLSPNLGNAQVIKMQLKTDSFADGYPTSTACYMDFTPGA